MIYNLRKALEDDRLGYPSYTPQVCSSSPPLLMLSIDKRFRTLTSCLLNTT